MSFDSLLHSHCAGKLEAQMRSLLLAGDSTQTTSKAAGVCSIQIDRQTADIAHRNRSGVA